MEIKSPLRSLVLHVQELRRPSPSAPNPQHQRVAAKSSFTAYSKVRLG